ncbi:hypothetical protein [Niveibacterium terrae]|uniref:hypothetical protein n=1 Tax=Niveibacterium terrae TaxID=3373598 RepID=UPI003A90620E
MFRSGWSQGLAIVSALILTVAIHRYFTGFGEFGDEGSFCTIGDGILDGGLPYRDFFNEKPPLQYLWTAAVMAVGEQGLAGARLAAEIALFLTLAIAFVGVARNRLIETLLPVAAIWALLIVMASAYRNTADESLALIFVACVQLLFGQDPPATQRIRALAIGLLLGIACGFRVTAGLMLVVLFASPWLSGLRRPLVLGAGVGLALWVSWLGLAGILPEAIDATLFFHVGSAQAHAYQNSLGQVDWLPIIPAWTLLLTMACAHFSFWKERAWFTALALAASVTFFARPDAFRLWPAMAMMMTVAVSCAGPALRSRLIYACLAALAVPLAWERPVTGSYAWVHGIVESVRRYAGPDEPIWVAPFAPNVYCLSSNPPASRYYFVLPWTAKPQVQQQIMEDLQAKPPRIVVEVKRGFTLAQVMPRAMRWLERSYVLVEAQGGANIWKLRDLPLPVASVGLIRVQNRHLSE